MRPIGSDPAVRRTEPPQGPDPDADGWQSWEDLLSTRDEEPGAGPDSALAIATDVGFGTSSSALIALPAVGRTDAKPVFRFAAGMPRPGAYRPVDGVGPATRAKIVSARGA